MSITRPRDRTHECSDNRCRSSKITIQDLRPVCGSRFSDIAFEDALIKKIGKTYGLFLERGIEILVNRRKAEPDLPEFAGSPSFTTTRKAYKCDGVDVVIMVGTTPTLDHVPRGWYVFCNGRMVLEADKTETTGWDKGTKWNPKHNHFLGQVYFASKDVSGLPWRTTKEGIEWESPVYQYALGKMRMLARPVQIYLRDSYPEDPVEAVSHREVLEKARGVSVGTVAKQEDTEFKVNLPKKRETVNVRIQYSRPRSEVKKIATSIGREKLSASRVGEYAFDYYLENICK